MPKNGPNSRNFYLMQAHCQSKLGRELGRRQVLGGACLLTDGMRVYIYEIGLDRLVVKEWTATTLDFASIEPEEVGESSRGLKGAWVKTKSVGNWRGENNEAKESHRQ